MNNVTNNTTNSSNNVQNVQNVASLYTKGDTDSIALLNEVMIKMGALYSKLRDLHREYNQIQLTNSFNMQKRAFDTKIDSISHEFAGRNIQATSQIISGVASIAGSVVGLKGDPLQASAKSTLGSGIGTAIEGMMNLGANSEMRKGQEISALSDYQSSLADQIRKRSDNVFDQAVKTSADLRETISALIQAYERISGSVRFS